MSDLKIVPKVSVLSVITTLDVDSQRVLQAALDAEVKEVVVIGLSKDGDFYFASSQASGPEVLWVLEKAKNKLLNVTS